MSVKFPHKAPKGYHYEQTPFKRNVTAIWICPDCRYDYNNGKPVKCIWVFSTPKPNSGTHQSIHRQWVM